jgi:hypothetical protein
MQTPQTDPLKTPRERIEINSPEEKDLGKKIQRDKH